MMQAHPNMQAVDAIFLERDGVLPCSVAHRWVAVGGRQCPHSFCSACSQAVFQCADCGCWDYGEQGGPAALDCASRCTAPAVAELAKGLTRQMRRHAQRQFSKGGRLSISPQVSKHLKGKRRRFDLCPVGETPPELSPRLFEGDTVRL